MPQREVYPEMNAGWPRTPPPIRSMPSPLLPQTPTPKVIGLDTIEECWELHSRPQNPPPRSPAFSQLAHLPRRPHSRRTTRATCAASPARRPRPPPCAPSPPRPRPGRGAHPPPPRPAPPCLPPGASPTLLRGPRPLRTPPHSSPGPQPTQPHPERREPRPPRGCRRATRPGADAKGALPQRRGREPRGRSGRGRRPRSVSQRRRGQRRRRHITPAGGRRRKASHAGRERAR